MRIMDAMCELDERCSVAAPRIRLPQRSAANWRHRQPENLPAYLNMDFQNYLVARKFSARQCGNRETAPACKIALQATRKKLIAKRNLWSRLRIALGRISKRKAWTRCGMAAIMAAPTERGASIFRVSQLQAHIVLRRRQRKYLFAAVVFDGISPDSRL